MKKIFVFLLGMICMYNLYGQNPVWILAPKYMNSSGSIVSLPIPTMGLTNSTNNVPNQPNNYLDGYDGQIPKSTSNAIMGLDGQLLFFIIDQYIYNKDGYLLEEMTDYYINFGGEITGTSEITIVPDPVNCNRYYILSSYTDGIWYKTPFIALLDMSLQNYEIPVKGRFENGISPNTYEPMKPVKYYCSDFQLNGWSTSHQEGSFIAASKLRSDNSRFVFISDARGIFRFKISSAGFVYEDKILFGPWQNGSASELRGEMELIQTSTGYKIACPYIASDRAAKSTIYTANLDLNGNLIPGSEIRIDMLYNNSDSQKSTFIKGLEFSANGDILYISHSTENPLQPNPIEFFNFNTNIGTYGLQPLLVNQTTNPYYGQIELGQNDKMYFSHLGGLDVLTNPNIPSISNFIYNSVPLSYYTYNTENVVNNPAPGLINYILPDQIDGMDYTSFFLASNVPTPSITANTNYCNTSMITMTGSVSGAGTVESYKWIVSKIVGSSLTTVYTGPLTSGTPGSFTIPMSLICGNDYRVTLQVQNSCGKMVSTSTVIHIDCLPTINAGPDVNICFSNISHGQYSATFNVSSSNFPVKVYKTVGESLILVGTFTSSPITLYSTQTTSYTFVSSPNSCGTASDVAVANIIQNHPDFAVLQTPVTGYFKVDATPSYVSEQSTPGYFDSYTIDDLNDASGSVTCNNSLSYSNSWHNAENFNGFVGTGGSATISNCGSTTEGKFMYGHQYTITRTTKNNYCPNKSVSAIVGLTQKNGKIIVIENEEIISTSLENSISISPNPTNSKFNIELNEAMAEKITIYNMVGKVVFEKIITEEEKSIEIDLSELPSSIYMVHVASGDQVITKKVVKN